MGSRRTAFPGLGDVSSARRTPWEFRRVWHLEPSHTERDVVYAGVKDAALFKSADAGATWTELAGLRDHGSGAQWQPGAGGLCLHTIVQDPTDSNRLYIAISAAGAFRTIDGGVTWEPINKGLRSGEIPDQDSDVGHCVHRIDMHASNPQRLYMQKHWDVMRSDNGGEQWYEVSGTPMSPRTRTFDSDRSSPPVVTSPVLIGRMCCLH